MKRILLISLAFIYCSSATAAPSSSATELEALRVESDIEAVDTERPNTPERVGKEKLRASQTTDVGRALKNASGVYIREEDGQGLRPNIGLRGTNPDRSKKVVLLEDGVLIGPAPYSAPAAYYTPLMTHVDSLEVYKGFASLPYGPNSIGGAVNYVSRTIPNRNEIGLDANYGSFNTYLLKTSAGGPIGDGHGYLLTAARNTSDGFKQIDGGGKSGYSHNDLTAQFRLRLPGDRSRRHTLTARGGFADENSRETYLGLNANDFFRSPYRRYAASGLDEMRWKHSKLQLEHAIQVNDSGMLKTTAYRHEFQRTWYRLDRFRDPNVSIREVLKNPVGRDELFYQVLRGEADSDSLGTSGDLVNANNDRAYLSQGVQTRLFQEVSTGPFAHAIEAQARFHTDAIDRNHGSDIYRMEAGKYTSANLPRQIDARNRDSAIARSFSLVDNASIGRFVLTGGARYELVDFEFRDKISGRALERTDRVFVPGGGVLYKLTNSLSVRTSVNRAVTLSGLDRQGGESREDSVNYEAGLKYSDSANDRQAELTFFENRYRNLTGTCSDSSGCAPQDLDRQINGGAAKILGVEARAAQGVSLAKVWIPIEASATLLRPSFASNFVSSSPEWGIGEIRSGDPLPYVPQIQYSLSIGAEYGRFRQDLSFLYQGKMFDQSARVAREEIPAYGVIDWSSRIKIFTGANLFAKVDNILGRNYIASYRPFGLRPGKPRAFLAGVSYVF